MEKQACGNGHEVKTTNGRIQALLSGNRWFEPAMPCQTFLRGIAYGKNLFVAVGGSYFDEPGVILTSPDGITWTRRHYGSRANLCAVEFGNGMFVTVGDLGTIFTSKDGIKWHRQHSGVSESVLLASVTAGNGRFLVGGESGLVLISTNGVEWILGGLDAQVYVGAIHFSDGLFIVNHRSASFTSTDGLTWRNREEGFAAINSP